MITDDYIQSWLSLIDTPATISDAEFQVLESMGFYGALPEKKQAWYKHYCDVKSITYTSEALADIEKTVKDYWDSTAGYSDVIPQEIPLTRSLQAAFIRDNTHSFTRNGDDTATVRDHEGAVHECFSGEGRMEGARRVRNYCDSSEDVTRGSWVTGGLLNVEENAGTGDAIGDAFFYDVVATSNTICVSVDVKLDDDSPNAGQTRLHLYDLTAATSRGSAPETHVLESGYKRITYTWTNAVVGNNHRIYIYVGRSGDTWPIRMNVNRMQVEQGVLVPSEYVSSGVGTSTEKVPSTNFRQWTDPAVPDGWSEYAGSFDANHYFEEHPDGIRVYALSANVMIQLEDYVLKAGKTYALEIACGAGTNSVKVLQGTNPINGGFTCFPNSSNKTIFIADADVKLSLARNFNPCDVVVTHLSLKEVDHGANVDGVKYFTTENGNTVDINNIVTEGVGVSLTTLKGYLSEPQSTNILIDSWDYAAGWSNGGTQTYNASLDATYLNLPFTRVEGLGLTGFHRLSDTSIAAAAGTTYVWHGYLKAGEQTLIGLGIYSDAGSYIARTLFDLATGTISSTVEGSGSIELVDPVDSIYEITITGTTPALTTTINPYIFMQSLYSSANVPLGEGYWMGPSQLETASFHTSYIPTKGAAETRNRDDNLYDNAVVPDKGSMTFTFDRLGNSDTTESFVVNIGPYASRFGVSIHPTAGYFRFYRVLGNTGTDFAQLLSGAIWTAKYDIKVAVSWDETTIRFSLGDQYAEVANNGQIPRGEDLCVGHAMFESATASAAVRVRDLKIYTKVFDQTKLQELTA